LDSGGKPIVVAPHLLGAAARHELLTIKTMAEQGSEIYRRRSS
jgi:hypothetical protein